MPLARWISVRLSNAVRLTMELISGLTIPSMAATAFVIHQKATTAPTRNAYSNSKPETPAIGRPAIPFANSTILEKELSTLPAQARHRVSTGSIRSLTNRSRNVGQWA